MLVEQLTLNFLSYYYFSALLPVKLKPQCHVQIDRSRSGPEQTQLMNLPFVKCPPLLALNLLQCYSALMQKHNGIIFQRLLPVNGFTSCEWMSEWIKQSPQAASVCFIQTLNVKLKPVSNPLCNPQTLVRGTPYDSANTINSGQSFIPLSCIVSLTHVSTGRTELKPCPIPIRSRSRTRIVHLSAVLLLPASSPGCVYHAELEQWLGNTTPVGQNTTR